jgi:hypothetical protein
MGRIRAALAVLLGRQQTPVQIQAEWAEMKADFLSSYQKLNALVARLVKAQKKLAEEQQEAIRSSLDGREERIRGEMTPRQRKQMLRSRVFGGVGGGRVPETVTTPENGQEPPPGGQWVPDDEEEEEP